MQVGLNTTSLSGSGALNSSVQQPPALQTASVGQKPTLAVSDYPASPLIATRPQRYSVQLNDQIATLQQADHYLGQLEQQLLDQRHAARRGGQGAQQQATVIGRWLDKRAALSGGTVDRQLQAVLQGEARVTFRSPALSQLLDNDASGVRLFSVQQGQQTLLSAVVVDEEMDPRQYQQLMSNALRRVGVRLQDQETFSTTESHWPQLRQTLSVAGDGAGLPAGDRVALASTAEPALAEELAQALTQGGGRGARLGVQQALDAIAEQRSQLAAQQEKARKLIDGMARFPRPENAIQVARALGGTLDGASYNYQLLAQAVRGQARLSSLTVRNLLE